MAISSNPTSLTFNDPRATALKKQQSERNEMNKQNEARAEERKRAEQALKSQREQAEMMVKSNDTVQEIKLTKSSVDVTV